MRIQPEDFNKGHIAIIVVAAIVGAIIGGLIANVIGCWPIGAIGGALAGVISSAKILAGKS